MKNTIEKVLEILIAVTALVGVMLMFFVYPDTVPGTDAFRAHTDYLLYFTVMSNMMVVVLFAGKFFSRSSKAKKFFHHPALDGAVTLYMAVTGLIFYFLLREITQSTGLDYDIANKILHDIIPIAVFLYWIIFSRTGAYKIVHVLYWLIFPVLYLVMVLVRGAFINWYPYPFIDVSLHGYGKVFINSAEMTVLFTGLGLVLFGLSKIGRE